MSEVIFLLDFPEATDLLKAVVAICKATEREQNACGEPLPIKFGLAQTCAENILSTQPVSQLLVNSMLDVIGGYYSAARLYAEKYEPGASMDDANELMSFANYIHAKSQNVFKPTIIK